MNAITLQFPGLAQPVILKNAASVRSGLDLVLNGWQPRPITGRSDKALSQVRGRAGVYDLDSPWLEAPFTGLSATAAVNGVCADLCEGWVERNSGALVLHAGGVQTGSGLVIFAGTRRAGKSTLAARLAAEPGMRLFTDDVLPVTADGCGLSLGIAPRLRLPLPDGVSAAFRDHVVRSAVLQDGTYAYLDKGLVAPHGTKAPVTAFVTLRRIKDASARLHHLPAPEAVADLLRQNMTMPDREGTLVDHTAALADRIATLTLVYSDLEEAADLFRKAFSAPGALAACDIAPPLPTATEPEAGQSPAPVDSDALWQQSPGTALRRRGELVWIWRPADHAMFHVNPVARAVWHLLEQEPFSARDIAEILTEAFPDTDPAVILADVSGLLSRLVCDGLIMPAG